MTAPHRIATLITLSTLSACGGHRIAAAQYTKSTYAAPGYEHGVPGLYAAGYSDAGYGAEWHAVTSTICGPFNSAPQPQNTPCLTAGRM